MHTKSKITLNYNLFSKHKVYLMGVSAIAISMFHLTFYSSELLHKTPWIYDLFQMLNIGVDIFLFLSGIGLYYSYSKKPDFRSYYIKRVINVFVPFLLINFPFAFYRTFYVENGSFVKFIMSGLSLTYWYKCEGETRLGWYVVYIMILYLAYPLIFKVLKKLEAYRLDFTFVVLFVAADVLLSYMLYKNSTALFSFIEIGLTRLPIFIVGCYFGKLVYNKRPVNWNYYILSLAGIMLKVFFFSKRERPLILNRFSQSLLAFSVMLLAILIAEKVRLKVAYNFVKLIGSMSLEFYLIHNELRVILVFLGLRRVRYYFLMLIATFVLSFIMSRLRLILIKRYNDMIKSEHNKTLR